MAVKKQQKKGPLLRRPFTHNLLQILWSSVLAVLSAPAQAKIPPRKEEAKAKQAKVTSVGNNNLAIHKALYVTFYTNTAIECC